MKSANKYFYISVGLVLLSFILNGNNSWVHQLFGSITSIVLFTGFINAIILIISIVMIDIAIKNKPQLHGFPRGFAKYWPFVILAVIIYHLVTGLFLFGIL